MICPVEIASEMSAFRTGKVLRSGSRKHRQWQFALLVVQMVSSSFIPRSVGSTERVVVIKIMVVADKRGALV